MRTYRKLFMYDIYPTNSTTPNGSCKKSSSGILSWCRPKIANFRDRQQPTVLIVINIVDAGSRHSVTPPLQVDVAPVESKCLNNGTDGNTNIKPSLNQIVIFLPPCRVTSGKRDLVKWSRQWSQPFIFKNVQLTSSRIS
jgi:hypothetical protein